MIFVTNLKEWYRLPTNKKEGIIFTTMMCFLMVLGMSAYNLWLHQDLHLSSLLILDVFIIGVLAKKIAFKLPVNPESKIQMILTISCLMVLGMVTCMSLFGVIMEQGIPDQLFSAYMNAWKMNVIAALPLQLIIVGPLSRSVLKAIQSNE